MKTIELRSLLTDNPKEIDIPKEIEKFYKLYKKAAKLDKIDPLAAFYAGYILSNPNVRDKFVEAEKLKII